MDHSKLTLSFGHSPRWKTGIGPALNSAVRPWQRCPYLPSDLCVQCLGERVCIRMVSGLGG
eukprot:229842-Rhodomonas_salina.2